MGAGKGNAKVDAYIAKAQPFAQPILKHLRALVHEGCPGVEETIKWSMPFFVHRGAILGNMSAFKEHCAFGFWGVEMRALLRKAEAARDGAMGTLGRITRVEELPAGMLAWIREAAQFIESGQQTSPIAARQRVVKPAKPALKTPAEFAAALKRSKKAAAGFAALSPSCQREYVEWIAEAKREETRAKRIATAIEWIGEGKQRMWKYQ
jgi:uncharacterized protein YdeI (YjbR/CyaY-like superfamily)